MNDLGGSDVTSTQGSDPEQDPPDDADEAKARCSGAGPRGSIFRSSSSPAAKVNDPKVN
jgi:hypothetical protein